MQKVIGALHLYEPGVTVITTNIIGALHLYELGVTFITTTNIIGALHLYELGVTFITTNIDFVELRLSVLCTFIDNICSFVINIGFIKLGLLVF